MPVRVFVVSLVDDIHVAETIHAFTHEADAYHYARLHNGVVSSLRLTFDPTYTRYEVYVDTPGRLWQQPSKVIDLTHAAVVPDQDGYTWFVGEGGRLTLRGVVHDLTEDGALRQVQRMRYQLIADDEWRVNGGGFPAIYTEGEVTDG